jgi:D-inositol-3-phosphate glycosyltransferase
MGEMNVCIYPAGQAGMALYTYKLANSLAGLGLGVTLFVDRQYELDHLPAGFVKVKTLSKVKVRTESEHRRATRVLRILFTHFRNWLQLFCYLQHQPQDILHIQPQLYVLDWLVFLFLSRAHAKVVVTVHDPIPHRFFTRLFSWAELLALRVIYRSADRLIVHTESGRKELVATYAVDEQKVAVIPHGEYGFEHLSGPTSEKEARSDLGLREDAEVFLFFGFVRKVKGIDVLLKAFDVLANDFQRAYLVIAGSCIQGESFCEHEKLVMRMRHGDRVRVFLRYIEHQEIPLFFEAADVIVLPYLRFFSQSGVLHLAQGFRKPLIVTDVGGLPEAVKNGETGLVVPPGNVEALVEAMRYLLQHKEKRREFGLAAYEVARSEFSWDKIAGETVKRVYT